MSKNNKPNDDVMKLVLSKLDKIDSKIENVDSRLNEMDKTLVKQELNLAEHMRRTDLLENKLEPVEKHVERMQGALKLVVIIGTIVGIAVGIAKLLGL